MRIHGAKQQREAVKRAPRKQLQPVFEVMRIHIRCIAWLLMHILLFELNHLLVLTCDVL